MKIIVTKITDVSLLQKACSYTMHRKESKASLGKIYRARHSPMRTQMFTVEMQGIPSFVSTHFVRHKIGVEHFVASNRDDRGGNGTEDRNTPVDHMMFLNAESLITLAHKRLCSKSHHTTIEIMSDICDEVMKIDLPLFKLMVPLCMYRNGQCDEIGGCWRRNVPQ